MLAVVLAIALTADRNIAWIVDDTSLGAIEIPAAKGDLLFHLRALDTADVEAALGQAREACRRANAAAAALDSQTAQRQFSEAFDAYARAAVALRSFRELAVCSFDAGAAAVDARQTGMAREAFKRALVLVPDLVPDPVTYPPQVIAMFAQVARARSGAAKGALTLLGGPAGAEVTLDGVSVGRMPLTLPDVTAEEHWLLVRAPGHAPFSARVTIEQHKVSSVDVYLQVMSEPVAAAAAALSQDTQETAALSTFAQKHQLAISALVSAEAGDMRLCAFDHQSQVHLGCEHTTDLKAAADKLLSLARPVVMTTPADPPRELDLETPARVHPALAVLPFGTAQFLEDRPRAGAILLVSQALLLAVNVTSYAALVGQRRGDGGFEHLSQPRALKWAVNVSFWLLVLDVVSGGVDGWLHRE